MAKLLRKISSERSSAILVNHGLTLASQNSSVDYDVFREYIPPSVQERVESFVRDNGGFCIDIGCGYMQVGRALARDFHTRYIGLDIIDHTQSLVFSANPSLRLDPHNTDEIFVQMDILSGIQRIPDSCVPLIFFNNFDTSTYLKSGEPFLTTRMVADRHESDLINQLKRILRPGGFIITLGTTRMFGGPKGNLEGVFEGYDDLGSDRRIFQKPENI